MMFGLCLSWRGSCFLKTSWSYILDLNLSTERLTSNKAFTNKLWNAGKFLLQNLPSQSDLSAWEALLAFKEKESTALNNMGNRAMAAVGEGCPLLTNLVMSDCPQITDVGLDYIAKRCTLMESCDSFIALASHKLELQP
ncbi:Valyl-tRNA synthetase [Forsythia ovata]|uniref:Valyl-tRNA synthetase n=1 Tax=Forsythia ovata TaxID=205694 RepID=A0ABD1UZN2_9LAMI